MPRKTAPKSKTTKKRSKLPEKLPTPPKVAQPHGGAIYQGGVPGHVGGGGRPKDEFKALCRELASGEMTVESLKTILADPTHAQFVAAFRYVTEQGYGKPVESVEVSGKNGGPIETRQQIIIGGVAIVF